MSDQLLNFAGSLAAIAVLVFLSIQLGLGSTSSIPDEATARALAEEAVCGFDATDAVVDAKGRAALTANATGQIVLIAAHGAHFSARVLGSEASARISGRTLTVEVGETAFPAIALDLGEQAGAWASRIDRLDG